MFYILNYQLPQAVQNWLTKFHLGLAKEKE